MDSGVRFQELADAAPVLIWRVDADGTYNWLNRTWLEARGQTLEQESGLPWGHAIHPADRTRCVAAFSGAFEAREPFALDYRLHCRGGTYRWMADRGRPFFLSDGRFAGYLGTCLDITDRKQAELRAQTALADARRALRQRDVLLSEVHHRVKNNLQVILSLLSLRSRGAADPATRAELQNLSRRIQAMGHVQAEIHAEADVSAILLVDFLRRLARPLAVLHGCDHIDIEVTGPPVTIDPSLASIVGLIMAELISNCFSHAFPRGSGRIAVSVSSGPAERTLISIVDSGPGFDLQDADRKGAVGLHIIRSLARQGDVELSHESGRGSRWTLALPAAASDRVDPRQLA